MTTIRRTTISAATEADGAENALTMRKLAEDIRPTRLDVIHNELFKVGRSRLFGSQDQAPVLSAWIPDPTPAEKTAAELSEAMTTQEGRELVKASMEAGVVLGDQMYAEDRTEALKVAGYEEPIDPKAPGSLFSFIKQANQGKTAAWKLPKGMNLAHIGVGAASGGILGALASPDPDDTLKDALIGGVLGGAGVGAYQHPTTQKFISEHFPKGFTSEAKARSRTSKPKAGAGKPAATAKGPTPSATVPPPTAAASATAPVAAQEASHPGATVPSMRNAVREAMKPGATLAEPLLPTPHAAPAPQAPVAAAPKKPKKPKGRASAHGVAGGEFQGDINDLNTQWGSPHASREVRNELDPDMVEKLAAIMKESKKGGAVAMTLGAAVPAAIQLAAGAKEIGDIAAPALGGLIAARQAGMSGVLEGAGTNLVMNHMKGNPKSYLSQSLAKMDPASATLADRAMRTTIPGALAMGGDAIRGLDI